MSGKVVIIGLGDLGLRLAVGLASSPVVDELVLAGRRPDEGRGRADVLDSCGGALVRFVALDASRQAEVEALLRNERPDVVVQCASLMSPWRLATFDSPAATAFLAAGFAAQLPAQLPLIRTLMAAARTVDFRGAVVNCSYPCVTNEVLGKLGMAPTIGIGNVGMIRLRVLAALRRRHTRGEGSSEAAPLVRVLAHHSQVAGVAYSIRPDRAEHLPQVFLGEEGQRADESAYQGPPLPKGPGLNALSCASGLEIIAALLPGAPLVRTCAPAPAGLPGGYPVVIDGGAVRLDLPAGVDVGACLAFQRQAARLDGVSEVADDGTVHFTDEARAKLAGVDPALAEPLRPEDAEARLRLMLSHI